MLIVENVIDDEGQRRSGVNGGAQPHPSFKARPRRGQAA